jgi:hypothetical protein
MAAELGEPAWWLLAVSARQHDTSIGGTEEIDLAARHDAQELANRFGYGHLTFCSYRRRHVILGNGRGKQGITSVYEFQHRLLNRLCTEPTYAA